MTQIELLLLLVLYLLSKTSEYYFYHQIHDPGCLCTGLLSCTHCDVSHPSWVVHHVLGALFKQWVVALCLRTSNQDCP